LTNTFLHHGSIEDPTLIKQRNAKARVVLRLCGAHMNIVVVVASPSLPLWLGTAITETEERAARSEPLRRVQNPVLVATWWLHELFKPQMKKPRAT
jgi:hypothetical protein